MKKKVVVAYATPAQQIEIAIEVIANCTVAMAIKQSHILSYFPEIKFSDIKVGIFSRRVALDDLLEEGDRIEIYRPLIIDPKQARRQRSLNGVPLKRVAK